MIRRIYNFLVQFGINPKITIGAFRNIGGYFSDLRKFRRLTRGKNSGNLKLLPCLHDKSDVAGTASGHYFHTDLLVAQKIFENRPSRHIDVGSSVLGFVSNVASFREIEVFDIREMKSGNDNIKFTQMDVSNLQKKYEGCSDSLSCLSVIEHIGLGRYGDGLDFYGYRKGFHNLSKMLKKGGIFYFSVPIGKGKIEFNAHRIFPLKEIYLLIKKNGFNVRNFSYVDDKGDLHKNYKIKEEDVAKNLGCSFGCGIWELEKK